MPNPETPDATSSPAVFVPSPADLNREASASPISKPQLRVFVIAVTVLVACFSVLLYRWCQFGLRSDLFSYTLMVPFISGYLIWTNKNKLSFGPPARGLAFLFATMGGAVLVLFGLLSKSAGWAPSTQIALTTLSFILIFLAICAAVLGGKFLRSALFPLGFLIFMVPLPASAEYAFESFLQYGSAYASYILLKLAGNSMYFEGTTFMLPGITLEVAPECSGIRSTLVLFLTSLIAGHLFLRNNWNKAILASVVIVLGIARNALRIFTLAQLCVHVSLDWIDSPLHHRGGPIFFALSLIPLFFLLWYLRKRERRAYSAK
ncbi:MAG: exosortase [Akkermansiaceae bacterium]|nr:exosortase [Verrucomicrobiales bacterium]